MLVRILYIITWFIIGFPTLCVACYKKKQTLWDWAFYFDNEEDGFDGSKNEFYDRYKGVDIDSIHWLKRAWYSYLWSAFRNPCFNLRKHPLVGVNVTQPEGIKFEGNTYHNEQRYSFEPNVYEKKWYKFSAEFNGKRYTSWLFMFPVFKDKYLIVRFGLKLYPNLYLDEYWLNKIKKEGWPEHKEYGLPAITIRVRAAN